MATIFTITCISATVFLVLIFIAELIDKHAAQVGEMVNDDGEHM